MVRWISLSPDWKLQDVQAGINVIITFLCAGGIFVLVRYFWVSAARKILRQNSVPAHSLLSLNTIGETVDVIWLLREELLFTSQYRGLLIQCIGVLLLTFTALMAGLIARYSTQNGSIVVQRAVKGNLALRGMQSIPYATVNTNAALVSLQKARFPQTQLLEFWPDNASGWEYKNPAQWNSSWSMDCQFENLTSIPSPHATDDCSRGLWTQFPQMNEVWGPGWDSGQSNHTFDSFGWRNNSTMYRDWMIFVHGVRYIDWTDLFYTKLVVKTVAIYLSGINATTPDGCAFGSGPITSAAYTGCTCTLTRTLSTKSNDELENWGAYPENFDVATPAGAYVEQYAARLSQESSQELPVTKLTGEELAQFYQAYMMVKDASPRPGISTLVTRTIDVRVPRPQISLITFLLCIIAAFIELFGLINYYGFMFTHRQRLDEAPQSKLDWMLQTLRQEAGPTGMRRKLRETSASTAHTSDSVPLTSMEPQDRECIES